MMNNVLRPYESYIDTGMDWLEAIPAHWEKISLRGITELSNKRYGLRNDLELLSVYREYGVVRKNSRDDNHNVESLDLSNYKYVNKGYLVLNKMKMWQGSLGVSKYEGIVSPAYIVCKIKGDINFEYLQVLLRSPKYKTIYNRISYGVRVGQWDMRYDDFKKINLFIPPLSEQDQIVKYLDHQLAKINKFIKAKKKLIAVLKEQKQAIINEVVTKGLDPNVKMKPSGIEWLGDVPEHWEISRNKNIMKVKKVIVGDNHKEYKLLSLTVNGVIVRDISSGKGKFPSDFSTYQRVDNGDLVFCLFDVDETPRTVGCAYDTGMITGAYTVFEVNPEIRDYVYFYYLAIDNKKSLKPLYTGLRKVVPTDSFLRSKIAIPPLGEINKIVQYINERTEAIDNSMKLIENEISLLMEYKNSLISDVVTGKVDVRNIVIEELEEEITVDIELDEDSIDEESLEAEDGDE